MATAAAPKFADGKVGGTLKAIVLPPVSPPQRAVRGTTRYT